jgi:hypothetical protein
MSKLKTAIRRELRVAFSPRAQPVWFRVIKWTAILVGAALFHQTRWFWWCLAGLALAGTSMHFIYRWKTRVWTRPWGGWNDLSVGRD